MSERVSEPKPVRHIKFVAPDVESRGILGPSSFYTVGNPPIEYWPNQDKGAVPGFSFVHSPGSRPTNEISYLKPFEPYAHNERYPRTGIELYRQALFEFFGEERIKSMEGKTILFNYLKSMGHGHRNQAEDEAVFASLLLGVRAVFFDPQDAISQDAAFYINGKNMIMQMIHKNKLDYNALLDYVQEYEKTVPKGVKGAKIRAKNKITLQIAKLAIDVLREGGMNENALLRMSKSNERTTQLLLKNIALIERTLTEKPLAEASLKVAKATGAVGIITTFTRTIAAIDEKMKREYIGDNNFPRVSSIPDNGYKEVRLPGEKKKKINYINDGLLTEQFAGNPGDDISYTVADDGVGRNLTRFFGIKKERVYTVGTISDSITPEEFAQKWQSEDTKILMPISGNAHNLPFIKKALMELKDDKSKSWLKKNKIGMTVYLADRLDLVEEVREIIEANGLQDFVEIASCSSVAGAAELKQVLQRTHKIEWRSPGENILTGADVGTCEVGLATEGTATSVNEPCNLKHMVQLPGGPGAIPSSYPQSSFDFWASHGFNPGEWGLAQTPQITFIDMIDDLLTKEENGRSKAENIALNGYMQANHDSNFRVLAIFLFDLFQPEGKSQDDLLKMFDHVSMEHRRQKIDKLKELGYFEEVNKIMERAVMAKLS